MMFQCCVSMVSFCGIHCCCWVTAALDHPPALTCPMSIDIISPSRNLIVLTHLSLGFSTYLHFGTDLFFTALSSDLLFSFFNFLSLGILFWWHLFLASWPFSFAIIVLQGEKSLIFRFWRKPRSKTGPETCIRRCVLACAACPFLGLSNVWKACARCLSLEGDRRKALHPFSSAWHVVKTLAGAGRSEKRWGHVSWQAQLVNLDYVSKTFKISKRFVTFRETVLGRMW